jgi:hypothetical protein
MLFYSRFSAPFATLLSLAIFTVARADDVAVQVELSSGETVKGMLTGVNGGAIRIAGGGSERSLPVDELVSLKPDPLPDSEPSPRFQVTLNSDTTLYGQDLQWDDSAVRVDLRRQPALTVPIKQIRSIRFRPAAAATDPQWLGLLDKTNRSDVMVIRRGNDQLDPIDGLVVGLDATAVKFDLDGQQVDAPLERLEGVIFRSGDEQTSSQSVKVVDVYGSVFFAANLEPADSADAISIPLGGDLQHTVKLEQIRSITWSSGRVLLAGEEPAEREMRPHLESKLPSSLFASWFGPRASDGDLVAAAGGAIEYRVDDGFETFAGSVQRDPKVVSGGKVQIKIAVDGEPRWEQTLADNELKGFRIPVSDARRLRLEVLAAGDGDVGDFVRFVKPRLLK